MKVEELSQQIADKNALLEKKEATVQNTLNRSGPSN
jgi:hypothetical protein